MSCKELHSSTASLFANTHITFKVLEVMFPNLEVIFSGQVSIVNIFLHVVAVVFRYPPDNNL